MSGPEQDGGEAERQAGAHCCGKGTTSWVDLLLVPIAATVCLAAVLFLDEGNQLRGLLGAVMVLLLPGYTLTGIVRIGDGLERAAGRQITLRLGMSLVISICITTLVSLVLHYIWEQSATPIAITLYAITTATFSCGLWLERSGRAGPRGGYADIRMHRPAGTEAVVLVVLLASVLLMSGTVWYKYTSDTSAESYTSFYMLNEDGNLDVDGYPSDLRMGEEASVIIGITNLEGKGIEYTIMVFTNASTAPVHLSAWNRTYELDNGTALHRDVALGDGMAFEEPFRFSMSTPEPVKLTFALLVDDEPSDYELHLYINT